MTRAAAKARKSEVNKGIGGLAMAEAITLRPIGELVPYANNARTHSVEQVAQIAASIREFGFTNPVLVDGTNGIIAGHGRVLAAQKLGIAAVPCIALAHLTEAQRRAYIIADNKLALNAGWDDALLRIELGALQGLGFDLSLTGFGEIELGELFAGRNAGLTDPDDAPALQEPVSVTGDLWALGPHRLLCGSATSADDHDLVIGGEKIDAVVTDPPYGVGVEYASFEDSEENVRALIAAFMPLCLRWPVVALFSGHQCLWLYPRPEWLLGVAQSSGHGLSRWGFVCFHPIPVWGKDPFLAERLGSRADVGFFTDSARSPIAGDEQVSHPVVKPVAWWQWLVERVTTRPGRRLLDPFLGSGTTLIAAEMIGRIAHCIEIEPRYVDVAVRRWQNFTGKEATLDGDGRSFAEIAASRA